MALEIPPLYDKKVTCHICNHRFTSKKVRSRFIRMEETWNDFYTVYKDPKFNPVLYEVYVCNKCGYAFTDHFQQLTRTVHIQTFKEEVSAYWKEQDYSDERTYEQATHVFKLSILAAMKVKQPHVVIAGLCMRLSWLYRYLGDEQEERYLTQAMNQYEKSLIKGDYIGTSMSELTITYLIGEIARQLGHHEKAMKYFSVVIEHKERHMEPKIVEKTREQWYLTRQQNKE
ncbi:DUF2225 domain-containing protein [Bacillus shivajii]|uniref:DUF2225 domain-containing protein n=1 Tax=Bacillus shivajii TaxID=1983719 RepID=UPI001CFADF43|nr:DUF2225 domain-containing protein [Bacillus shivajii]UCZ54177.1 DUF2225 domain-containing protein [Bacillus shivajii]